MGAPFNTPEALVGSAAAIMTVEGILTTHRNMPGRARRYSQIIQWRICTMLPVPALSSRQGTSFRIGYTRYHRT